MEKNQKQIEKALSGEKITRKQAIKKVGTTALAASSLLFLSTQAKAKSSANNGWGNGDQRPPGNSGPNNGAENDLTGRKVPPGQSGKK